MKRNLEGTANKFLYVYASIFTIIQIIVLLSASVDARIKYVIFIGFTVSLTFIKYKANKRLDDKIKKYDIILAIISIICAVYYIINYEMILNRSLQPTTLDIIFASITIGLVIEACRRTIGLVLPTIAIIALLYAFFGDKLPGMWGHRPYSLSRIVNILYMTDNGIFGTITKVATTTVFIFMLVGVFFKKTNIGNVLTDLITSLTSKFYGGSALVSVISSSLFGMISGSAASNVVTTGQFTIPMMKKEGFKAHFAAAVEAVSSAGGTLTPPVLGAAVFIMIEILGIEYNVIVKATMLPAIIFYASILFMVYFTARKQGIKGSGSDINTKKCLKDNWISFIPVIVLISLILLGYPLIYTAIISTIVMIIIAYLDKKNNINKKEIVLGIGETGISCLPTAMACVCSGIIIGVLNLTSLSVKFSEIIISLSSANIIFALIATMLMLVVLGMGLPAVASYIIGSSIAAPVLISIGIPTIAAHLFIFYFSCLSSITPPVALNAYLAAGIAHTNPIKTALVACKLCLPIFVVPYMIIFQPALMLQGSFLKCIIVTITCILGVLAISIGIIGYVNKKISIYIRILILILGILLLDTSYITDILAIFIVLIIFIFRKKLI